MNEDESGRHLRASFEGSYRPPGPGFDARMRAGLMAAPPPNARTGRTLGLVAVILVLAAILALTLPRLLPSTTLVPSVKTQGGIPWKPLPPQNLVPVTPSPSPSPLPAGTRPCSSAQLKVNDLGRNGAGGTVFRYFGFSGRGPAACFVQGTPAVELFDRSGRKLPFKQRSPFGGSDPAVTVLVEPGPIPNIGTNLRYGQAGLGIDWVSQPEQCPGSSAVQIAFVSITLANGGPALTVALSPAPGGPPAAGYACQGLGVDTFRGPPPGFPDLPIPPLPALALKAPASVRAGQDLVYQATLTNDTPESIDLVANCPNIEEELLLNSPGGGQVAAPKPAFQLNCAPAGVMQTSASLTFEIHLAVPKDAAPGSYTLYFAIEYWNATSTPASAPIRVSQ